MLARVMTLVTRQNLIAVQHASAWFNRPRSTYCTRVPSSMSLIFDQVPPKVIRISMVAAFQLSEGARGLCCWLLHFRDLYQSANVQIWCTRPFVEAGMHGNCPHGCWCGHWKSMWANIVEIEIGPESIGDIGGHTKYEASSQRRRSERLVLRRQNGTDG